VAAVDRFDPHRGIPFTGFAIPTILGELKRYFRDAGWSAHVPRGAQEAALRVEEASRQLTVRTGRAPNVGELAQYLELDTEQLAGLEAGSAHFAMSLDAPVATTDIEESPCRSRLRSSVRPSGARSAIRRCIRVTLQRFCRSSSHGGGPRCARPSPGRRRLLGP
jgi:DNA-directed RNA polymerase specialized sigma subunit